MAHAELHERLVEARQKYYSTARDAAEALGVAEPTYFGHENGSRRPKLPSMIDYARKFDVELEWLLTGRGQRDRHPRPVRQLPDQQHMVPLVGFVAAGAEMHFLANDTQLGEVAAPLNATEETVAAEVRGDSLGALLNGWLVFYNHVHRPVTDDLINQVCVVGLDDGRVMIKKIKRSKARKDLFHLESNVGADINDVSIEWAARVRSMMPR